MANVSKLFYSTAEKDCFLCELEIDKEDHVKLKTAKAKIRQHLKDTFKALSDGVSHEASKRISVTPRFFTQGSYAYKTLNEPACVPPQQMDLDDGCYLPLSFVKGEKPSQAASLYFDVVDEALQALAKNEGWKFDAKDTCARLIIDTEAHVDVPLYAIPDKEFRTLESAAISKRSMDAAADSAAQIDHWKALPSDCVLLAHRKEGWIISDPRKISDWFNGAIALYGERLRRVCRYLKAWRDHHSDLAPVSSILLMACAFKVFEDLGRRNVPERDDAALLKVAESLPDLLGNAVFNPAVEDERLDKRLSDDDRRQAVARAGDLRDDLSLVVHKCVDPGDAIRTLRSLFGDRIPDRADFVHIEETARAEVKSRPPKITAAPAVGRSISG